MRRRFHGANNLHSTEVFMSTATIGRGHAAAFAFTLLGLAFGACDVGSELDQDSLDLRGGRSPDAGTKPANGTAPASGVSDPGTGPTKPPPPPGTPAACVMRESGNQVCVVCTDADGKVVKEGCYTRDPAPPNTTECHEVKRNDGTLCTVCLDAKGTVIKASCRSPEPPPCSPGMDPRGEPITCKDYVDGANKCTICIENATGRLVKQGCSPIMSPNDPVMCEEKKYPDGTVCSICTDASGQVIRRGCSSPMMPGPPPAPDSRCKEERKPDGQVCVTCFDEKGNAIRQACWYPEGMGTGMSGGTAGMANN
jgi:hypothetical protein